MSSSHADHVYDVQKVLGRADALMQRTLTLVNEADRLKVLCALAVGGSRNTDAQLGTAMADGFRGHLGVARETLSEVIEAFVRYRDAL